MPEIAWIMAPTTSPSSATWLSTSSARSRPRAPCASRSSGPDGRTHTSPKSSPKSEMRLPWAETKAGRYGRRFNMYYLALATDYDGTLAHDGIVDLNTLAACDRLR